MNKIAVFLFRRDLRVYKNKAFASLVLQGYKIIPLYINDEKNEKYLIGKGSQIWLKQALASLNKNLLENLQILEGDHLEILRQIKETVPFTKVVSNQVNTPTFLSLDLRISNWCNSENIIFESHNEYLLLDHTRLLKENGEPYKVFTPFYKKFYESLKLQEESYEIKLSADCFHHIDLNFLKKYNPFSIHTLPKISLWDISEEGAQKIFTNFIKLRIANYQKDRDFLFLEGTSKLAPYLHFGQISAKQIWLELQKNFLHEPFMRQLAWREFAYYTLKHNPNIHIRCINVEYENFFWETDDKLWRKWENAETGIPIIDAGLIELRETGYMHNRVRMIVASFLTKNCNIDWRFGQEHFWESLFDADWANNSFGWQWVAGCGCDAAPYYRIFNPVLQSQKFDANGNYIKKFLPQFAKINSNYVHTPWLLSKGELKNFGLEQVYSSPIIEIDLSRKLALERHKKYFPPKYPN